MTRVTPALGVCYYPEHWPEENWTEDARRMAVLGLTFVRIGEFAWSRLEPEPGRYDFDWLRQAIDTLHAAGLKIVLGTPTATPPKWLVDRMPDMLPVDATGRTRKFGSRRHYCFSHPGYRGECARIVEALARDFGTHPAVAAWQTDNEYDCHGTTLSFSDAALHGFREWLARKYQSPTALNRAWGNVFWSMEYRDFSEIELPNATVAEANPAHWMDFRRFSSDQVASFDRLQVDIIRRHSPGRDVIHNFMGRTLAFDHFELGAGLDVSAWDSYPLGFLADRAGRPDGEKARFLRAGHPDFQAFHHDLYRATSHGRWWVMEQQPGPVNWAPYNPAPRPGMVRLWSWEAFAHGAEVVSYFRWRQAPFAQEQMHAGLLRPDHAEAPGFAEAAEVAREIAAVGPVEIAPAPVAIVFDYPSAWAWEIQPQGRDFDYFLLVFDLYRSLRRLGLDVDFVRATEPRLDDRRLVLIPGLFSWPSALVAAIRRCEATVLIGPRSGSKTQDFAIPADLPPDLPSDLLDVTVTRVETLPPFGAVPLAGNGGHLVSWREFCEPGDACRTVIGTADGWPALLAQDRLHYLAGWPDDEAADLVLAALARETRLTTTTLPEGVRMRRAGPLAFFVNYSDRTVDIGDRVGSGRFLIGSSSLEPSGVAAIAER